MKKISSNETRISVFQNNKIRKVIHNGEWWFSISDIVEVLTESTDVKQYIKKMKKRDLALNSYWGTHCTPLEMISKNGKKRKIISSNTEGVFRIIQSIPSPKAEPFKIWLAKVGYERIQEIENPELATQRTRELYKAKGYSDSWIDKRMRGMEVRETLTNEWRKRGAKKGLDYAILTSEISKATFGMTPSEYQSLKGLKKENLRDHMDDIELILTMFGEATTTRLTQDRDSKRMTKLKKDAQDGGKVAGNARRDFEKTLGKSVISNKNYLKNYEGTKKLK